VPLPLGWALRRGTVALPVMEVNASEIFFSKINVKIEYFSTFLQAEMVSSAVASPSLQG